MFRFLLYLTCSLIQCCVVLVAVGGAAGGVGIPLAAGGQTTSIRPMFFANTKNTRHTVGVSKWGNIKHYFFLFTAAFPFQAVFLLQFEFKLAFPGLTSPTLYLEPMISTKQ